MKNVRGIMMENGEAEDGVKESHQMQSRLGKELSRSEIPRCNEQSDIRDKVTSGEPFTSSAQKRLKSEYTGKVGEFSATPSQDDNLHSDTTCPSDSGRIGKAPQAKDTFNGSAKGRQAAEHKGAKKVEGIGRNKQLNS